MKTTLPSSIIAEGTSLVEQFLSDWVSRTSTGAENGEGEAGDGKGDDEVLEKELEGLKEVYEEWKERLEGSQWVREVLSKTA